MQRDTRKITLFNNITPVAVTSSTDATPIVVTATAHGFVTGQRVLIAGHTTNLAANGIWKVTVVTANTFSLQDEFTGASVAGSGGGAGSGGICLLAPAIVNMSDFINAIVQFDTSGTATTTVKIAGSAGKPDSSSTFDPGNPRKDIPNFAATISPSNPYQFLQVIDLDTAAAVNGATGLVASAGDVSKNYEVNINAIEYLTAYPVTWTQGAITLVLTITNNS